MLKYNLNRIPYSTLMNIILKYLFTSHVCNCSEGFSGRITGFDKKTALHTVQIIKFK